MIEYDYTINPWIYENKIFDIIPDKIISFVYCITNLSNNKKYIGKKGFYFSKTSRSKGKIKKYKIESDWKQYYGSNDNLKNDVSDYGERNFRREIIKLCHSKSEASYYEIKNQLENDVLLYPDKWYNEWFSAKITRRHMSKYLINGE